MDKIGSDPLFRSEESKKNLHPLWQDTPGYRHIKPIFGNEALLGVFFVVFLFLSQIPWVTLFKMIPFLPSLKSDHLLYMCLGLIVIWRFLTQVSHDTIGQYQLGGRSAPLDSKWNMYDIAGEMVLTVGLCLLVAFKNVFAFLIVGLFLVHKCTTGFPAVDAARDYFPEDP